MILYRDDWDAQYGTGSRAQMPRRRLTVHHFYRPHVGVVSRSVEEARMRSVERYHADNLTPRNPRIGYNGVVFQSGRAYIGCGLDTIGAHSAGNNTASFGLAFAIDGDRAAPTDEAWRGARELVSYAQERGFLVADHELDIDGHRNHSPKSCPGDEVFSDRYLILRPPGGRTHLALEGDDVLLNQEDHGGTKRPVVGAYQRALQNEAKFASRGDPLPRWGDDGFYGDETESAVTSYQRAAGISDIVPELGSLDGLTRGLLDRYIVRTAQGGMVLDR